MLSVCRGGDRKRRLRIVVGAPRHPQRPMAGCRSSASGAGTRPTSSAHRPSRSPRPATCSRSSAAAMAAWASRAEGERVCSTRSAARAVTAASACRTRRSRGSSAMSEPTDYPASPCACACASLLTRDDTVGSVMYVPAHGQLCSPAIWGYRGRRSSRRARIVAECRLGGRLALRRQVRRWYDRQLVAPRRRPACLGEGQSEWRHVEFHTLEDRLVDRLLRPQQLDLRRSHRRLPDEQQEHGNRARRAGRQLCRRLHALCE